MTFLPNITNNIYQNFVLQWNIYDQKLENLRVKSIIKILLYNKRLQNLLIKLHRTNLNFSFKE